MIETFDWYKDSIRSTFHDFLNHELIAKDPYSISEEEIWGGIKSRSNIRPKHRCDLINRMNHYCTLVMIKGHKVIHTNYNPADYGLLTYTYNQESELQILYSTFKYPHSFHDEGMGHSSFGGNGKSFRLTIEDFYDGSRHKICIGDPSSLFENPVCIGTPLFLEYDVLGSNSFGSIKPVPSFVNIEGTESYFIYEVRLSLLKTKYFLLNLVENYPTHLMHMPGNFAQFHKGLTDCFHSLYNDEMKLQISKLKESISTELSCYNLYVDYPF